jgi:TPR repeat protein
MSMRRGRCSVRAGRGVLRSPGHPSVGRRHERRRFWVAIAVGRSSEDAAIAVGVSPAVGRTGFRETGGMPPSQLAPSALPQSGRYLVIAEREELVILRAQGHGVREMARRLARDPSTISRELRRNAATRGGGFDYRATTAQWYADRAARRPKPARLGVHTALRAYVDDEGVRKNRRRALQLYLTAAKYNHPDALASIGAMHWNGEGVARDRKKALSYYRKAARLGSPDALFNLGQAYHLGQEVPSDQRKSLTYLESAARRGHVRSQFRTGEAYLRGIGTISSRRKAGYWLRRAARAGDQDAKSLLRMIEKNRGILPRH